LATYKPAKTKVQKITGNNTPNRRERMFKALDEHYLGVGAFVLEMTAAEKILATVFYYTGERKPHMWWDEFE
jgi:hypothetical protein